MCAAIASGRHTDLQVIRQGSLTAARYRYENLRPHVVPMAAAIGPCFISMDDNARPHRAQPVDAILQAGIECMVFLTCS